MPSERPAAMEKKPSETPPAEVVANESRGSKLTLIAVVLLLLAALGFWYFTPVASEPATANEAAPATLEPRE